MIKETLSEKRKELFEIILNQKPTAGRIYRIILKQDREFIKKLKEIINYSYGDLQGIKLTMKEIDKLAGEELIK